MTKVTERHTKRDFTLFASDIAERYASAKSIMLIMDNLNTHRPELLYEVFEPGPRRFETIWNSCTGRSTAVR